MYKIKRKADGSLERKKARLIIHDFNQIEGIDFEETYNPMIRFPIIHIIISLVLSQGWTLRQLDVDNVFLNSDLEQTGFMSQPLSLSTRSSQIMYPSSRWLFMDFDSLLKHGTINGENFFT